MNDVAKTMGIRIFLSNCMMRSHLIHFRFFRGSFHFSIKRWRSPNIKVWNSNCFLS